MKYELCLGHIDTLKHSKKHFNLALRMLEGQQGAMAMDELKIHAEYVRLTIDALNKHLVSHSHNVTK